MSMPAKSLRSALGSARGLGSAKDGLHHWWGQRLTALALIPLSLWFVVSILSLMGGSLADYTAWVSNPVNATILILTLAVTFHHAQQGLQVIIEDYVSHHGVRSVAVIAVKFACLGLSVLTIFCVLKVAFGA